MLHKITNMTAHNRCDLSLTTQQSKLIIRTYKSQ